MLKLLYTATTVAALAVASAASAAVVTVEGIVGTWGNTQGSATVTGEGTSSIRWGDPATANGQSGYDFVAKTTPFVPASSPFDIGTFTHLNWPVFPPSIEGADLTVSVMGNVDGNAFTLGGIYRFSHFETPNNANPCAAGGTQPCPDLVTYEGAVSFFGDDVTLDGEKVFLGLTGFTDGFTFLTAEGQTNSAILQANFTTEPIIVNQVPLPAGAWLMLTGMALVGGASWNQKRRKS